MNYNFQEQNRRLFIMFYLTFLFFLVELTCSRLTSSLTALSDAFHTLSSVIIYCGTLLATSIMKTQFASKNTFGWARVEVMGILISTISLTGLCITVILEAVKRLAYPRLPDRPTLLVGIGTLGLFIRLLGLFLFWDQRYCAALTFSNLQRKWKCNKTKGRATDSVTRAQEHQGLLRERFSSSAFSGVQSNVFSWKKEKHFSHCSGESGSKPLHNFQGIFFQFLKDAFGSVIVIMHSVMLYLLWNSCTEHKLCHNLCTGTLCKNYEHKPYPIADSRYTAEDEGLCWLVYLDSVTCIILSFTWVYTSCFQLKESAHILLQAVPKNVDLVVLKSHLQRLQGVMAIHELHIWQLTDTCLVGTVHVKCQDANSFKELARKINIFFHSQGINAITIQPEFNAIDDRVRELQCDLACDMQCMLKQCCYAEIKRMDNILSPVLNSLQVCAGLELEGTEKHKSATSNYKDLCILEHETSI
ncbi:zinc transporter 1-like [Protopterus annectens]|uniref:zinc transporter 1-like n=1 Tax=Protopterus annectens TaxID=7888 RepID=UPI001CFB5B5D|nr:zinc transporter 1-like [Protopterus annectens]